MDKIKFGIVGAGWRTEFFLRIVQNCPERFGVTGVVVRNPEKAATFAKRWGVPVFATLEAMLEKSAPSFVVSSVPWDVNPGVLVALSERGVPALSETPPAPNLDGMLALWEKIQRLKGRVQVAEQVHLRPHHVAQLAIAASGKLGTISQAQVSVAHGYHGISLMRKFLGITFEPARVHATEFKSPLITGAGRGGPPEKEGVKTSTQHFIRFDFGDKLGLMDFTGDQYFAWIRDERLLVRGERGELSGRSVAYLKDFRTPIRFDFVRHTTGIDGDLQGNHLQGIQAGEEWVYRNAFAPASLMDDEIAIATALVKMDEYVRAGREFYPLAEGMQDHYLNIVAQKSLATGATETASAQPWSRKNER